MKSLFLPPVVMVVLALAGLFGLSWTFLTNNPSEGEVVSDDSEGYRIYIEHCARCHDEDGAGIYQLSGAAWKEDYPR